MLKTMHRWQWIILLNDAYVHACITNHSIVYTRKIVPIKKRASSFPIIAIQFRPLFILCNGFAHMDLNKGW